MFFVCLSTLISDIRFSWARFPLKKDDLVDYALIILFLAAMIYVIWGCLRFLMHFSWPWSVIYWRERKSASMDRIEDPENPKSENPGT